MGAGGSLDYTFRIPAFANDYQGDLVGLICGHPTCSRTLKDDESCPHHDQAAVEEYVVQMQLSHTKSETTLCPGYFRLNKDLATDLFGMTASEYVDLDGAGKDKVFNKFFDIRYIFIIKVTNANTLYPQKTILSVTPFEE